MSFPGSGLETTYRNNLREVAKMLQSNHQDKYMVRTLLVILRCALLGSRVFNYSWFSDEVLVYRGSFVIVVKTTHNV